MVSPVLPAAQVEHLGAANLLVESREVRRRRDHRCAGSRVPSSNPVSVLRDGHALLDGHGMCPIAIDIVMNSSAAIGRVVQADIEGHPAEERIAGMLQRHMVGAARATEDTVVAVVAEESIDAAKAKKGVVAPAAMDLVIAVGTGQQVVLSSALQRRIECQGDKAKGVGRCRSCDGGGQVESRGTTCQLRNWSR